MDDIIKIGSLCIGFLGLVLTGFNLFLFYRNRTLSFGESLHNKQIDFYRELIKSISKFNRIIIKQITKKESLQKEAVTAWVEMNFLFEELFPFISDSVIRRFMIYKSSVIIIYPFIGFADINNGWEGLQELNLGSGMFLPTEGLNGVEDANDITTKFFDVIKEMRRSIGTDKLSNSTIGLFESINKKKISLKKE